MGSGASIQVDAADVDEFNHLQGKELKYTHEREDVTIGVLNFGQKNAQFISAFSLKQEKYDLQNLTLLRVEESRNVDKRQGCTLRIVAINDVYELDNFPNFATAKRVESVGADITIATLAGRYILQISHTLVHFSICVYAYISEHRRLCSTLLAVISR